VPEVVVRAHRHEGEERGGQLGKSRIEVAGPVVRDHDDVHAPQPRLAQPLAQSPLPTGLEVAGHQQGDVTEPVGRDGQVHADGCLVDRGRVRRVHRGARGRQDHSGGDETEGRRVALPDGEDLDRGTGVVECAPGGVRGAVAGGAGHEDPPHRDGAENRRQPAGVVGVVVREDDGVQPVDARLADASGGGAVGVARVHEDRRALARADEQGGGLADVALGDDPALGRAGARDRRGDRHETGQDAHHRGDPNTGRGARPRTRGEDHDDGSGREQTRAGKSLRQREGGAGRVGEGARDPGDPGRVPAGDPGEQLRGLVPHGLDDGRQQPQDGRARHGRGGQDVGRDSRHRKARVEEDDDGPAGELGGRGDRQAASEPSGNAEREPAGDRAGEHDDRCGRRHGQDEPDLPGDRRVDEKQADQSDGERRKPARGPAHDTRKEDDRAGRGGAQHGRLRAHQRDEPEHDGRADERGDPRPPLADDRQHTEEQQGDVGTADRSEVGEAGDPGGVLEVRGKVAVVPDSDPRHEPARLRREVTARLAQALAQTVRGTEEAGGLAHELEGFVREDDRQRPVGRVGGARGPHEPHDRADGESPLPWRREGEHLAARLDRETDAHLSPHAGRRIAEDGSVELHVAAGAHRRRERVVRTGGVMDGDGRQACGHDARRESHLQADARDNTAARSTHAHPTGQPQGERRDHRGEGAGDEHHRRGGTEPGGHRAPRGERRGNEPDVVRIGRPPGRRDRLVGVVVLFSRRRRGHRAPP
jgi:hypothetical protein